MQHFFRTIRTIGEVTSVSLAAAFSALLISGCGLTIENTGSGLSAANPVGVSCQALPAAVTAGAKVTLTATGRSFYGQKLAYSFTTSAGSVSAAGSGSQGVATLSTGGIAAGSVQITCKATDDQGVTASAGATLTVQPATSAAASVTLTATPNPAMTGQPVSLTVAVSAADGASANAGTVSFLDNGAALGDVAVDASGKADFTLTLTAAGTHVMTAVYSGGSQLGPGQSSPLPLAILGPRQPAIACSAAPGSVFQGANATITAQASSPGGRPLTYRFTASAGTLSASGSTAVLATANTPPGPVAITCTATDDQGQSASAGTTVTVQAPAPLPVSVSLMATPNPVPFGQDTVVNIAVVSSSGSFPLGEVALSDNGIVLWSGSLTSNGTASQALGGLAAGGHSLTASYSGSSRFQSGQSAALLLMASPAPPQSPTLNCASSPDSLNPGASSKVTASGNSPQGRPLTYSFSASAGSLGDPNSNTAVFSADSTPPGPVQITCSVTDDQGATASAVAVVTVLSTSGEQALPAFAFTDSLGVNVHLHFGGTPYLDAFPQVMQAMEDLGVKHWRNGLDPYPYPAEYANAETLGKAGMRGDWILDIGDTAAIMNSVALKAPHSVESFEGPNEDNQDAGPVLRAFMRFMHDTLRAVPATANKPLLAPSLTEADSYPKMGDISSWITRGNMHDYYNPRNPETLPYGGSHYNCGGYGSMNYNICLTRIVAGTLPVISTETGYSSKVLSDTVIAKYGVRTLFEHLKHGVSRTYLYELIDISSDLRGILRADLSPKPVYTALRSVMALLKDQNFSTAGKLDYTMSSGTASVEHLLLQKSDGSFYLAVWQPAVCANPNNPSQVIHIPPQPVSITLRTPIRTATAHTLDGLGRMSESSLAITGHTLTLSATDQVTLVELAP